MDMKRLIVLSVVCSLILPLDSYAQLKVNSSGYVGINQSSPSYNLDWSGTGRFHSGGMGDLIFDHSGYYNVATIHPVDNWNGCLGTSSKYFNVLYVDNVIANLVTEGSDERIKENIRNLENPLSKLANIRGVQYDFKKEFFNTSNEKLNDALANGRKNQIGFIAQELKEVFPELVFLDTTSNLYSVNYIGLIPVLVEAVKEQQKTIEDLQVQVENCCQKAELKSSSLIEMDNTSLGKNAILYQNVPNPFSMGTTISCYIPESSQSAIIYIFDMQGTELQQFPIAGVKEQSVKVDGNTLKPGMFLYSLVVDNKEVDTKRMILTK
jgi:hypothetical protein